MMLRSSTLSSLAFIVITGCALFSSKPVPVWKAGTASASSEQLLREVVVTSLQKRGFPIGAGIDPAARVIESGWYASAAPFKGKGWRQKAIVEWSRGGRNDYDLRVRVQRESNESLRPLDPAYAKWEPAPDHQQEAQIVLQYVQSSLASDLEVGDPEPKIFPR